MKPFNLKDMILDVIHCSLKMIGLAIFGSMFFSCKNEKPKDLSNSDQDYVNIGIVKKIYSEILDQEREVWIYKPSGYYGMNEKEVNYPVVYVMDGESQFMSTAAVVDQLSSPGSANDVVPQMMVVGIVNIDRNLDLTPTLSRDSEFGSVENSGGANDMAKFMEKELIPYIDSNYSTSNHRTLIGHSLGGLYVLNTLLHHRNLFSNYLSIDPFLGWDDEQFSKEILDSLNSAQFDQKQLYIALANNSLSFNNRESALQDTSMVLEILNAGTRFSKILDPKSVSIDLKMKYYDNENHFQIPLPAMYDGFNFFFDFYTFENISDYYHPSKSGERIVPQLKKHFENVSDKMGYTVKPMESYINSWAWGFVQLGNAQNAKDLLELNIDYYSTSAHVYVSMAHFMLNQKDTTTAKKYFEQSLEIQQDSLVIAELNNLENYKSN